MIFQIEDGCFSLWIIFFQVEGDESAFGYFIYKWFTHDSIVKVTNRFGRLFAHPVKRNPAAFATGLLQLVLVV